MILIFDIIKAISENSFFKIKNGENKRFSEIENTIFYLSLYLSAAVRRNGGFK